jgi:ubiquinone biosynthesis UbiH/UbiF/VisC/COQ6 family hydroxylase
MIINPPMRDLIVVGGGPVGASLVRAARGLSVALVAHAHRQPAARAAFDARVYALSPGNVAFLESLGVWQAMPQERLVPVHAMRIYGAEPGARLEFDAYGAGVPALAWIVEDTVLQDALWQGVVLGEAQVFAPATCQALDVSADRALLRLGDGREVAGKLIVGADGAQSFVRAQALIAVDEGDYGQSAVVANFRCEKPHRNVAYQWFQRGAVLALLPLPGAHVSMVWSLPAEEAGRVSGLGAESLCREVAAAARGEVGDLTLVTPPRSYALRRLAASRLVAPRVALAGDAGHVIHPLAGQGLNLGLQDARALSTVLAQREPFRDPGELRLLRRYERSRAEPILAVDTMVDSLFRTFGAPGRLAARARNIGLNLTDRLPVLKNMLMRYAMMCFFGLLFAVPGLANEAQIRRVLEPKLGGAKIEGIQPAPISGLWEVHFRSERGGMQVIYTDATASYVIDGNIHELRTNRDLTGERLRKLNAVKFESLPLDMAVKIQRGNGKRVLAMFSDPYCPACREFERTLSRIDDITVYVFMYPVIRPQNADHSRAVWCSPDRAKAWLELAASAKPKVPEASPACPNPVDKLIDAGHRLGVNSTPTLFLANGERLSGGLGADDLKDLLDRSATARR